MISRILILNLRKSFFNYFNTEAEHITENNTFIQAPSVPLYYHIHHNIFIGYLNNRNTHQHVLTNGAIHFRTTFECKLMVEECMFENCFSGGIYFVCSNQGSLVVKKCCASKCCTDNVDFSRGQFLISNVPQTNLNIVEDSSIALCSYVLSSNTYDPLYIISGQQSVLNVNLSQNRVNQNSAIYSYNPNQLNISFSTFADNTPTHSNCINVYLTNILSSRSINYCNFIRNSSPLGGGVTYLSTTVSTSLPTYHLFYLNCLFLQNSNTLFFVDTSTSRYILIGRSWIEHSHSLSNLNYVSTSANVVTAITTATFAFDHFRSHVCNPIHDPIGYDLTPCQTIPPLLPTQTECSMSTIQSNQMFNILLSLHFLFLVFF